ncbi:MAG: hypothetical protein JWQ38_1109 [Flavipsychrobacter sp.]|nr:hypothetical protein [Flavipsychrobacter sp.]
MDNNANKERWIDEVMESTYGITKAQPRADLYGRVTAKISQGGGATIMAIPVTRWVAAAMILLALNIGSAVYYGTRSEQKTTANDNPFAAAMQAESTYNY